MSENISFSELLKNPVNLFMIASVAIVISQALKAVLVPLAKPVCRIMLIVVIGGLLGLLSPHYPTAVWILVAFLLLAQIIGMFQ
jgi:hypothetical protein